jgi:hypothetical protein
MVYQPPPPPVVEASGWYLRGDVGVGIQNFKTFDHTRRIPRSSGRQAGPSTSKK